MHIGILQTGHAPDELIPESGEYPDMFVRLLDGNGFEFSTFAVVDGEFPQSAEDADGWLITGSKHSAYEDLPWIPPLEDLVRAIHADGRPLVGICFGHQIIAQALGGKVEKFAGGWCVGRTTYDMSGEKVELNAWHQDQVVEPPKGAKVIGSADTCANAAMAIGDSIYTIQPHPEYNADFIAGLMRTRGRLLSPELIEAATATLPLPTRNADIGHRIAAFFLQHQKD